MKAPRRIFLPAILMVALALFGCQNTSSDGSGSTMVNPFRTPAASKKAQNRYTVMLRLFSDPTYHKQQADHYKAQTERFTRWSNLFVLGEEDKSRLCWGRYRTAEEAQENLKTAQTYVTPLGAKIYAAAVIIRMPAEDIGPPEWKLKNAPGVYTVLVAVFYDMPEAKYFTSSADAVAYCERLRKKGYDAYYHHSSSRSVVTVGSFPAEAVDSEANQIRSIRMRSLITGFEYLAVNGHRDRLKIPIRKKRRLQFDPEKWGSTRAEALRNMKDAVEGYKVVEQRPYPVRIPNKRAAHAPKTDPYPRYRQSW